MAGCIVFIVSRSSISKTILAGAACRDRERETQTAFDVLWAAWG